MDIIHAIVVIQVIAVLFLGALLIAVLQCIRLIDKSIRQREKLLFNASDPMPRTFQATATQTPLKYPVENLVPESNVSGYKTQAQADAERLRAQAPDVEDLLPRDNE
ncbi:MAG: hypothetical protein ACP5NS_04905 [Candidatus Pacearchaeota archaeon]